MTDKQIITKGLECIEHYLCRTESSIDIARDYIQEILDALKINEEVENFLLELSKNETISTEISEKAGELWKEV